MVKKVCLIIAIVLLCGSPPAVYSQRRPARQITIKLASMVPANTPWGVALNRMAAEWSTATNGEVRLQIYPNGTQGNEIDVLQKLNMNVVQAAVFTSMGLNSIVPEIMTLSCPFLIRNNEELTVVLNAVQPDLEAAINSQNYFSMALVRAGWVKIFSKAPVFVPADLKRMKVGCDPYEPAMTQVFKSMGYQITPVDGSRMLIALNAGTVEALYNSPIISAGFQFFGVAKNMATVNIAPFLAGIVINKHTWEMIPEQHRPALIKITRQIGTEIGTSLAQLESDAVTAMSSHGLVINEVDARQEQEWYADLEKAIPALLDSSTFDRATYDKIDRLVKAYRSGR
ncbi:C4-dicarboxylate ABC transporter substrate-binding protein [Spirochaetia bacterium]|nr:C4-dicarboxylate ABC transporter substrate-binding protein [Spirochaetia bacterium]